MIATTFLVAVFSGFALTSEEGRGNLLNAALLVGTTGGLIWTANGIHHQYHHNLLLRASHYVEAWYQEDLRESIQIVRSLTEQVIEPYCNGDVSSYELKEIHEFQEMLEIHSPVLEMKYRDEKSLIRLARIQIEVAKELLQNPKKEREVADVLAFFEHMGQDVKFKNVDVEYLKDFFYLIVIRYYEVLRVHIESLQQKYSHSIYSNFVYLAQTWEKDNTPPLIPRMAVRDIRKNQEKLFRKAREDGNISGNELSDLLTDIKLIYKRERIDKKEKSNNTSTFLTGEQDFEIVNSPFSDKFH